MVGKKNVNIWSFSHPFYQGEMNKEKIKRRKTYKTKSYKYGTGGMTIEFLSMELFQ